VYLHQKQFSEAQADLMRAWRLAAAADSGHNPKDKDANERTALDADTTVSEPDKTTTGASEAVPETKDSVLPSPPSWQKELAPMLRQAQAGLRLEAEAVRKRKEAMKKAFTEASRESDLGEGRSQEMKIRDGTPPKDNFSINDSFQSAKLSSLARRAQSAVAGAVLVFLRALLSSLRWLFALPPAAAAAAESGSSDAARTSLPDARPRSRGTRSGSS
jgi:hypothetical protein